MSKSPSEWSRLIGKRVIYVHEDIRVQAGKFVTVPVEREVKLLAVVGIWAMARCKGATPFVAHVNQLKMPAEAEAECSGR